MDFFVTDTFGEGLYNSCKDVKFGTMNTRALEFVGAGAQTFRGKLCFQFAAVSLFFPLTPLQAPYICTHKDSIKPLEMNCCYMSQNWKLKNLFRISTVRKWVTILDSYMVVLLRSECLSILIVLNTLIACLIGC